MRRKKKERLREKMADINKTLVNFEVIKSFSGLDLPKIKNDIVNSYFAELEYHGCLYLIK